MDLILCILAGGQSRRFGSSKLNITLAGEPILAWQARRLGAGLPASGLRIARRWLSLAPASPGSPSQAAPPGADRYDRVLTDPVAHQGPLAAIAAILGQADESALVAVVPADMPLLEPRHLAGLAAELADHPQAAAAMSRWTDGPHAGAPEPLPSLWRAGPGLRLVSQAQARGIRGPSGLAADPAVACIPLLARLDADAWRSVNTPEDMRHLQATLKIVVEALPASP